MTKAVVFNQADVQKLIATMSRLTRKVAVKHMRIALNAWGGVVRDEARQNVLEETRLLKRSLSVKVVIPDASYNKAHHGKPARVMVGPDRKTVRAFLGRPGRDKLLTDKKATARVLAGGKVRVRKPSRYAHLVEKKHPFIAPAQAVGAREGFDKLARKLKDGLEQEANEANRG